MPRIHQKYEIYIALELWSISLAKVTFQADQDPPGSIKTPSFTGAHLGSLGTFLWIVASKNRLSGGKNPPQLTVTERRTSHKHLL